MNAKSWLKSKKTTFEIKAEHGGVAGSLLGLGYIKPLKMKNSRQPATYTITTVGRLWTGQTPLHYKD